MKNLQTNKVSCEEKKIKASTQKPTYGGKTVKSLIILETKVPQCFLKNYNCE